MLVIGHQPGLAVRTAVHGFGVLVAYFVRGERGSLCAQRHELTQPDHAAAGGPVIVHAAGREASPSEGLPGLLRYRGVHFDADDPLVTESVGQQGGIRAGSLDELELCRTSTCGQTA